MKVTTRVDRLFERLSRGAARRVSRRSFLGRLSVWMVASSTLPLLPVARPIGAAEPADQGKGQSEGKSKGKNNGQNNGKRHGKFASDFANQAQTTDPTKCDYWRYCSSDGYLCACCGGGPSTCPPGTKPSPTSWIGSCINPDDGKTYLIAYRDCCGQDSCGRCACLGQEGDMPSYRPQVNNDIVWCFGAPSMVYHCSSAGLVGLAE
jgi:methylamine dehydrogenase light chain